MLLIILINNKYDWVVPLKDKKGISIVNVFQKILKESDRKPNKIWVDKDMILRCIRYIMKKYQLLLTDLLEH